MSNPHAVMSVDPQSNVVDVILGIVQTSTFKRCHQNRGKQLKPRVIAALEGPWTEGSIDKIKFLGFGRRWFVVLNADKTDAMHNHHPPLEWRIPPNVLSDITRTAQRNFSVTPKEVQKGVGMNYRPMELSLAAANIDRIRSVMKKARQEVDKIDNERVNPFKIIASFPAIKKRIDESNLCQNTEMIEKMVDSYQLRGDNAYCFGRERQFAHFQSPFQAFQWANAEVLFVDIDYTGCHHFPYLLNIVCQNNVTSKYMACGRSLLNQQDAVSIGRALSVLVRNVIVNFIVTIILTGFTKRFY